jgi:hypothetical protein
MDGCGCQCSGRSGDTARFVLGGWPLSLSWVFCSYDEFQRWVSTVAFNEAVPAYLPRLQCRIFSV